MDYKDLLSNLKILFNWEGEIEVYGIVSASDFKIKYILDLNRFTTFINLKEKYNKEGYPDDVLINLFHALVCEHIINIHHESGFVIYLKDLLTYQYLDIQYPREINYKSSKYKIDLILDKILV